MKKHFYLLLVFVLIAVTSQAQEIPPSEVTLFKNVNIFDGENEKLLQGYDVLVVKNLIKKIDKEIEIADTYVIDARAHRRPLAHHVKRYPHQHDDEYRSGLSQHRSC
jgi:hypothetical protein